MGFLSLCFQMGHSQNCSFFFPFQVNPIVDDVHKRGDAAVKEFVSSSFNLIYDLVIVVCGFLTSLLM